MKTEAVDGRHPEPEGFPHLQESTEFIVNDNVSMVVDEGEITFINYETDETVTMSEWDFGEADIAYLMARVEEKNPTLKANRLEREKYEAEQEQI